MLCRARLLQRIERKRPPLFSKIGPSCPTPPVDPVRFVLVPQFICASTASPQNSQYCIATPAKAKMLEEKNPYLVSARVRRTLVAYL